MAVAATEEGRQRRVMSSARYLGMPAFLLALCLILYLWVQSLELDSIEQRLLNEEVIRDTILRHLQLVLASTAIVIVFAVPLGILLTRGFMKALVPPIVGLANVGQAVPSLGVIVLLALLFGVGFRYAVVALVLYAFLPVLRNTMVGLQQVDIAVIEAGRGMGMTKGAVLRRIELPLAVPVIIGGIRIALVINVGTATIAVFTNAGGLGQIILLGIQQNRFPVLVTGSVLAGVLALFVDYVAGIAEERLHPRGI